MRHFSDDHPIEDAVYAADLSCRTSNGILNELTYRPSNLGLKTVGDLRKATDRQLLRIKNIGRKSLTEIRETFGTESVPGVVHPAFFF